MNTIYLSPENSEISDPNRLLVNLPEEINLKRRDIYIALSNLSIS